MRIPEPTGKFPDNKIGAGKMKKASDKKPASKVTRDRVNESDFMKELDSATEEQVKKSLDVLVEEIAAQASLLAKHRTFGELDRYKKMVKDFMQQAIQKIYAVKVSDSSKLMIKRKKVYVLVERVNAELEDLAKKLIDQQAETLDLLASLDRIRGILVDMYS
jgi:uncharacterized protein YaaR (DUF327 family)